MINRKDTAPNHLVEKHADESPSTLHGAILDLDPKIDTESGAIFRNSGDMLRVLSVASSTALLIMHRKSYLRCQNLPEVVQLSNKLPDLGPGIGLQLAAQAMSLISHDMERCKLPDGGASAKPTACGCYGA
jgi:hypothetical protein